MRLGEPYLNQRIDQVEAGIRDADSATRLGRITKQLSGGTPTDSDRELVRLRNLGREGRIAEGCLVIVARSQELWDLVAAHDLPEDISDREYTQLLEHLLGNVPDSSRMAAPFVSIKFSDADHVAVVRRVFKTLGGESDVTAYRYARLPYYDRADARNEGVRELEEPFLVALYPGVRGENRIVGILPAGATFLRHEKEFESIDPAVIAQLDSLVLADRAAIADLVHETLEAIHSARRRRSKPR